MKKVVNISLASTAFIIEEDAYIVLKTYLDSIEKHFSDDQDSGEIISDIEKGIAEKLIERVKEPKDAISLVVVEGIITEMGRVEDITENDWKTSETLSDKSDNTESHTPRQLFRSSDDVVVAGVASGIANYLNTDPTFIRVAFIVFSMFSGAGVLAYLLLWLIVPVAETTTQKYQMRGQRVTLSNIVENIQEGFKRIRGNDISDVQNFWNNFLTTLDSIFRAMGKGIRFFFKFIRGIVGSILTAGGLLLSLGLVFGAIWIIHLVSVSSVDPTTFVLINEIKGSVVGILLLTSSFLVILAPAILVIMAGIGILRKINYLYPSLIFGFGAGWILAFVIATSTFFILLPSFRDIVNRSSDTRVLEERIWHDMSIDDIPEEVLVGGNVELRLIEGDKESLRIFAGEQELKDIHVSNKGGSLSIDHDYGFRVCLFCSTKESYMVELYAQNIKSLEAGGRGIVIVEGGYSEDFEVSVSGSFKVSAKELSLSSININTTGSHDIMLTGTTTEAVFDLGGSSTVYANSLSTETVSINARGANSVYFNPYRSLSGTLTGANNIYYIDNEGLHLDIERFPEGSNNIQIIDP